ncbi:PREDICTED: UPF0472 protein C16orf72 homolog [Tinamus guttatus]|uniref:UPF0472 protein C16orf72 homolog n=1 Tax=Tinamus guttatus TaxID=94827 RepID=UPI00052E8424|nr:PREDICTED: UPF0472 protein C16orf72 homolog [Tinamus guttatus]
MGFLGVALCLGVRCERHLPPRYPPPPYPPPRRNPSCNPAGLTNAWSDRCSSLAQTDYTDIHIPGCVRRGRNCIKAPLRSSHSLREQSAAVNLPRVPKVTTVQTREWAACRYLLNTERAKETQPFLSKDRVCQQPGLSLWVPFQNAATAVTNLYKESVDVHQRSFDVGIQIGYQRRNKDVLAWVKKRRRTIRREDLISFLCGKVPPPRNSRAPPRLTVVSPNRATSTETSSSVETDLQPFREAIALHGLSGAMASISVRSSTPGSPTHVSSGSNASRRRNGLHDVDLNTFISEEMALHLDNGGTRKRTSAQCGDVITDSPTHKRNRMI